MSAPSERPCEGRPAPDDEGLTEAFWAVAHRLRHLTRDSVTPLGITPGQARAINVLRRGGEMRLSDLSNYLRIAPRSATEVVDALEDRALITRSADPADRRATLVTLTPAGDDVAAQLDAARAADADALFARLSDEDRVTLTAILRTLRQ